MLNKVQKAAFDLIQSDARFIYTLVDMQNNAKNIISNFVLTLNFTAVNFIAVKFARMKSY